MKKLMVLFLVGCLVFTLMSVQAIAFASDDETTGVSFLKTNLSETITKAAEINKPILLDFWTDG